MVTPQLAELTYDTFENSLLFGFKFRIRNGAFAHEKCALKFSFEPAELETFPSLNNPLRV